MLSGDGTQEVTSTNRCVHLEGSFLGDFTNLFPEQPEICSTHIKSWGFGGSSPVTKDFQFNYLMVTMAKKATIHHFTHKPSLFTSNRSKRAHKPFSGSWLVCCSHIQKRVYCQSWALLSPSQICLQIFVHLLNPSLSCAIVCMQDFNFP